jgi:sulfate/thiosulfate transport system permease protein
LILLISFLALLLLERLIRRPGERMPRLFGRTRGETHQEQKSAVAAVAL